MFPDAGKRDRRITIQQRTTTDQADSSGTPNEVGTWTTLVQAYAEKMAIGGRERFDAEQRSAPYDTRWRIGYRADMDPELVDVAKVRRLTYKSRIYDIVDAQLIDRRHGVDLLTLAGGTIA
jgi:SPP1 family predicted phage head-tail adaptor